MDIGTTSIKVVELKKENNLPVFVNYAVFSDPAAILQSNGLELLDGQIKETLAVVLKRGNFSAKQAVIGIPGFSSLVTLIDLPEMPEAEIEQAVKFEAAKYIPTPLEEVSLGWEVIGGFQDRPIEGGQSPVQGRKIQVMVVTVPRTMAAKYEEVARSVKLNLAAMEVENFAAVRSLVGADKGTFMIVNIGAKSTDFTIVSDGVVRIIRNIDVGGSEISRSLVSGLGIDLLRADKLKKSKKIDLLDSRGEATNLIGPTVGLITDEIKRLREIYHKKNPLKKIEKLILTGGTSKMNTIADFFSKSTGIECQRGNPLARIGIEKKHLPVLEEAAPELAVAIGLAMRGLESQ